MKGYTKYKTKQTLEGIGIVVLAIIGFIFLMVGMSVSWEYSESFFEKKNYDRCISEYLSTHDYIQRPDIKAMAWDDCENEL
jgi:hypothetical protein